MFKRKVKINSEKVIEKVEDFLRNEGWNERLEPDELYAFRYALGSMKIDINNPSIIKRIKLYDILSTFRSSRFIIFSESNNHCTKTEDNIFDLCSKLNERMIFLTFSHKGGYVAQIYVYLPTEKDTSLFIKGIYRSPNDICVADSEKDFISDLERYNKELIKYHFQDNTIVSTENLDYSKEFFSFTNLDIKGSTITFHYVP